MASCKASGDTPPPGGRSAGGLSPLAMINRNLRLVIWDIYIYYIYIYISRPSLTISPQHRLLFCVTFIFMPTCFPFARLFRASPHKRDRHAGSLLSSVSSMKLNPAHWLVFLRAIPFGRLNSSSCNFGMDHLGFELRAICMLSGRDTTRPISLTWKVQFLSSTPILTTEMYPALFFHTSWVPRRRSLIWFHLLPLFGLLLCSFLRSRKKKWIELDLSPGPPAC